MIDFSAEVSAWVRKSERRILTVFKESAQDVISEMQAVGPSVANPDSTGSGNMPVDTGALRASLQASLNRPRSDVLFQSPKGGSVAYDASPVAMTIAGAKLGDTIYAVYGVAYGRAMEAKYGFVRLAAQNWPRIVTKAALKVQSRVGG